MTLCNALRRARAAKAPVRRCDCRTSSSGYTPRLGIRGKYIPGTTAPLRIPQVDLPAHDELPRLGSPQSIALPASLRSGSASTPSTSLTEAPQLPAAVTDAPTRIERTQAVRSGVLQAYQKVRDVPLVPLPHRDFVPPYLKEKQRWQRATLTFSWWTCAAILFWGVMFSQLDKAESVLHPIRNWFLPKWDRWWTLTPYDRLVLGLRPEDEAERIELQTLKQMAYRPPREMDTYWQTARFANPLSTPDVRRDFSRQMPVRPEDR